MIDNFNIHVLFDEKSRDWSLARFPVYFDKIPQECLHQLTNSAKIKPPNPKTNNITEQYHHASIFANHYQRHHFFTTWHQHRRTIQPVGRNCSEWTRYQCRRSNRCIHHKITAAALRSILDKEKDICEGSTEERN